MYFSLVKFLKKRVCVLYFQVTDLLVVHLGLMRQLISLRETCEKREELHTKFAVFEHDLGLIDKR